MQVLIKALKNFLKYKIYIIGQKYNLIWITDKNIKHLIPLKAPNLYYYLMKKPLSVKC